MEQCLQNEAKEVSRSPIIQGFVDDTKDSETDTEMQFASC